MSRQIEENLSSCLDEISRQRFLKPSLPALGVQACRYCILGQASMGTKSTGCENRKGYDSGHFDSTITERRGLTERDVFGVSEKLALAMGPSRGSRLAWKSADGRAAGAKKQGLSAAILQVHPSNRVTAPVGSCL